MVYSELCVKDEWIAPSVDDEPAIYHNIPQVWHVW